MTDRYKSILNTGLIIRDFHQTAHFFLEENLSRTPRCHPNPMTSIRFRGDTGRRVSDGASYFGPVHTGKTPAGTRLISQINALLHG